MAFMLEHKLRVLRLVEDESIDIKKYTKAYTSLCSSFGHYSKN